MSMKIQSTWKGVQSPCIKPMNQMKDGEVCYELERKRYVMMISGIHGTIVLILQDNTTNRTNTYSTGCSHEVRELYPNENIAIKFS